MEITTNTNTPITSYFEEARDGLAGDTASQVAAMMLEHTRLSRAINQEQNQSEEAWLRQQHEEQIRELKIQADLTRQAGMLQGALTMVAGGVGAASGVACGVNSDALAAGLAGASKAAEGGASIIGAYYQGDADKAGVRATEFAHRAQESERRLEDLAEARARVRELTQSALDHLRAVQESEASANQAIATWRG